MIRYWMQNLVVATILNSWISHKSVFAQKIVHKDSSNEAAVNEALHNRLGHPCLKKPDRGSCDFRPGIFRWFYNPANMKCQLFLYSGCGGNANRFWSRADCEKLCFGIESPKMRPQSIADQSSNLISSASLKNSLAPLLTSGSRVEDMDLRSKLTPQTTPAVRRQSFSNSFPPYFASNPQNGYKTIPINYANTNLQTGPQMVSSSFTPITYPYYQTLQAQPNRNSGIYVRTNSEGYNYNTYNPVPIPIPPQTTWFGLNSNSNPNFVSSQQTIANMGVSSRVMPQSNVPFKGQTGPICSSPKDPGQPCTMGVRSAPSNRFYWNYAKWDCLVFAYEGCGGNSNNFVNKKECLSTCRPMDGPSCIAASEPMLGLFAKTCRNLKCPATHVCRNGAFFAECCPKKTEDEVMCKSGQSAYRLNNDGYLFADRCAEMNCPSNYECEQGAMYAKCCMKGADILNAGMRTISQPTDSVAVPAFCIYRAETGPCRSSLRRWYFDVRRMECVQFMFGGCGGNENNFQTKQICQEQCLGRKQNIQSSNKSLGSQKQLVSNNFVPNAYGGQNNNFIPNPYEEPNSNFVPTKYKGKQSNFVATDSNKQNVNFVQNRYEGSNVNVEPDLNAPVSNFLPNDNNARNRTASTGATNGSSTTEIPNFWPTKTNGPTTIFGPNANKGRNTLTQYVPNVNKRPNPNIVPNDNGAVNLLSNIKNGPIFDSNIYKGANSNSVSNDNNEDQMQASFNQKVTSKPTQPVCLHSLLLGECRGSIQRWHYSHYYKKCLAFIYTGCGGNSNNFQTAEECMNTCKEHMETGCSMGTSSELLQSSGAPLASTCQGVTCRNGYVCKESQQGAICCNSTAEDLTSAENQFLCPNGNEPYSISEYPLIGLSCSDIICPLIYNSSLMTPRNYTCTDGPVFAKCCLQNSTNVGEPAKG